MPPRYRLRADAPVLLNTTAVGSAVGNCAANCDGWFRLSIAEI